MIKGLKCVRNALRNITRRRTSIGAVGPMLTNTEVKYGGAAVREAKTSPVVNFPSICLKMMRMKRKKLEKKSLRTKI